VARENSTLHHLIPTQYWLMKALAVDLAWARLPMIGWLRDLFPHPMRDGYRMMFGKVVGESLQKRGMRIAGAKNPEAVSDL